MLLFFLLVLIISTFFSFHARHRSVSQQVWLETHLSISFKSWILFPQDNSAEPWLRPVREGPLVSNSYLGDLKLRAQSPRNKSKKSNDDTLFLAPTLFRIFRSLSHKIRHWNTTSDQNSNAESLQRSTIQNLRWRWNSAIRWDTNCKTEIPVLRSPEVLIRKTS
jgi:hypothetical protein